MTDVLSKMPNGDRDLGNWLLQVAMDYAAARCCLLNGMFPGFVLAQQAVEKALKAYIRIADPSWKPSKKDRVLDDVTYSHDLLMFARKVDLHYPSLRLEADFRSLLEKLSRWFEGKYPDGKSHPGGGSTAELAEVDNLLVPLLKDIPIVPELRVRTGIYARLWNRAGIASPCLPEEAWLTAHNAALLGCVQDMITEIRRELVPDGAFK